jgi:hypothetical protein
MEGLPRYVTINEAKYITQTFWYELKVAGPEVCEIRAHYVDLFCVLNLYLFPSSCKHLMGFNFKWILGHFLVRDHSVYQATK